MSTCPIMRAALLIAQNAAPLTKKASPAQMKEVLICNGEDCQWWKTICSIDRVMNVDVRKENERGF